MSPPQFEARLWSGCSLTIREAARGAEATSEVDWWDRTCAGRANITITNHNIRITITLRAVVCVCVAFCRRPRESHL